MREYSDNESNEEVDLSSDLNISGKELDFDDQFSDEVPMDELEQLAKRAKQGGKFSLKARRAIEDHLEERKLQKETDYLFDDDFASGSENGPNK